MNFLQKIILKIEKNFFSKKEFSFLFLIFAILLVFFFPLSATAAWYDFLVGAFTAIPALMILTVLAFIVMASGLFASLAGLILNWVTSPGFVSLSYTTPCTSPFTNCGNTNPIIGIGLDITKHFVNLALVVILVYIAVAIALRLGETNAKKWFARLILVALLVNFAPVLVGLIVDAANITMNYFLVGIKVGISNTLIKFAGLWESMASALLSLKIFTVSGQSSIVGQALILISLNFATGLALLLFAVLFTVRYIAIWVLVILSPLAFVAWILPVTKKYWDMWWSQLVQWSIIGIPLAFFLYLGARAYEVLPGIYQVKMTGAGIEPLVVGTFNQTFPYYVVLAFLYLGFAVGLSTSAMGAPALINWAKKSGKATGRLAGMAGRRVAGRVIGAKGKEWMEKEAATRFMPEKIREMKGLTGIIAKAGYYAAAPATGTFWALRRGIGEAGLKLKETEEKEIKTAEEKYKGANAERKWADFNDPKIFMRSRAGILRAAIEDEQIDDFRTLGRKSGLTDNQINTRIIAAGKESLRTHPDVFKKIRDAYPQLAEKMGEGFAETTQKAAGLTFKDPAEAAMYGNSIPAKITAKIKPANIPKTDIEGIFKLPLTDPTRVQIETAMHKFWTGEQVGAAAKNLGRTFIEPFMALVNAKGRAWYESENERLATYLDSSAAKGLGLELP